ncbi:MAG TPA: hypothetical protein VMU37_03210, partial [Caulobacteraceae bacterium]|nr:hypothetical protein [Caulobacteraceae bacterium]
MQINWIHGTGYSSAPSWLGTVLADVATFYDKLFTNDITIDATVNWVPLGDTANGGILAENELSSGPWGVTSSFSTVSAALVSHAQYATQTEAYSNMPSGVGSVYVAPGEAI